MHHSLDHAKSHNHDTAEGSGGGAVEQIGEAWVWTSVVQTLYEILSNPAA